MIAWPAIDRERSMATTTLFEAPRLRALSPATVRPFSVSFGGTDEGNGATTVSSTRGYPLALTCLISPPAASAAAGTTRARTRAAKTSRLT